MRFHQDQYGEKRLYITAGWTVHIEYLGNMFFLRFDSDKPDEYTVFLWRAHTLFDNKRALEATSWAQAVRKANALLRPHKLVIDRQLSPTTRGDTVHLRYSLKPKSTNPAPK